MTFSGAVLAGGRSARFGADKARFIWRGKPLMQHVLESLEEADERFIVANRPYPEFGLPVYPDVIPGGDSLSGLHAALLYARSPWVAVAACDLPRLDARFWRRLLEARGQGLAVVALGPSGYPEPLAALYSKAVLPIATRHLQQGELRVGAVLEAARAVRIPWEALAGDFDPDLFANVNTPSDLP